MKGLFFYQTVAQGVEKIAQMCSPSAMLFAPLFVVGFEKKMIKYIFKYNIFSVVGFEKNDQGHPHRCGTSKRERIGSVQSSLLSAGI